MDVLLTVAVIVLLAVIVMKKNYPVISLMGIGIAVLLLYSMITGQSVMGDASAGNRFVDVFEFVKDKFLSTFTTHGLVLMPVVGYAAYMNYIGASKLLALHAIRPFRKVKSPYFLILIVVILGGIMRLAIPSQTSLIALLMVTVYPVLLGAGMSKVAAASTCVVASAFDWGPACPTTAMVIQLSETNLDQSELFVNYQLGIFFAGLAVTAVLAFIVNQVLDKKDKFVLGSDAEEVKEEEVKGLPAFYCVLPMQPLIIMIICSKAVLGNVVVTAFGASVMSLFVTLICEFIRHRSVKPALDGTKEMFKGMGNCFCDMITLIAAATVFAGGVQKIGGFQTISGWLVHMQMPGIIMILAICAMAIIMTICIASNVPSSTTFSPFVKSIAQAGGLENQSVLLPLELASGLSRSFSPISAANVFTSKYVNIPALQLIKRNAVPLLGGLLTVIIISVTVI